MDDETLLRGFLNGILPPECWHHREHVKVAYLLLRQSPLETAINQMRQGLQALNAAQKVPDAPNRGYNEVKPRPTQDLSTNAQTPIPHPLD